MLPFDNKSEFQVVVDMPDGTTLEQTTRVTQALGSYLRDQPEVVNYQIYSGTSGPYNFNGLVRHYFLRSGPNVADIQVNLLPRNQRSAQSHEIARRLRPNLQKIAEPFGARIKVAEVPPGPPVLETLVAEVYGPSEQQRLQVAAQVKKIFQQTRGVTDVDWYVEDPQTRYDLKVDLDKAALHGVAASDVSQTVGIALNGADAGLLHVPESREDVPIVVRLARADRSNISSLANLKLPTPTGQQIALGEVTKLQQGTIDISRLSQEHAAGSLCHWRRGGRRREPGYAILKMSDAIKQIKLPDGYGIQQNCSGQLLPNRPMRAEPEVGWRMAHHRRSIPRPWAGVRGRTGSHLRAGGRAGSVRSSRRW